MVLDILKSKAEKNNDTLQTVSYLLLESFDNIV